MNPERLAHLFSSARDCSRRLRKYGSIRANQLPKISLTEDQWLRDSGHSAWVHCTRTMDYDENVFKEDVSEDCVGKYRSIRVSSRARPPQIREVWVGATSLDILDRSSTRQSFLLALEQEASQEMADYAWMLYYDPEFDGPAIDDPETGERRPVRTGDSLIMARGSNDDLDALFGDEPTDDRSENDAFLGELFREHIRANNYLENELNADSGFIKSEKPKLEGTSIVNGYLVENADLARRVSKKGGYVISSDRMIQLELAHRSKNADLWERASIIAERIEKETKAEVPVRTIVEILLKAEGKISFNEEHKLTSGYFADRSEYFTQIETNLRATEKILQRPKARPLPVDWRSISDITP